jgi:putative metallohydrolase (TIGR04338 family)
MQINPWHAPDQQREKLYRAEKVLPDTWRQDKHLHTVPQIETWTRAILRKPWFKERWPHVRNCKVVVTSGQGMAEGSFDFDDTAYLDLPRWCRSELGVLHELAHVCVPPNRRRSAHGPAYAGAYLYLVEKIRGVEEAQQLRESFDKHKVKYTIPKVTKGYHRRRAKKTRAGLHVGV